MSAYVEDKAHIDALLSAALDGPAGVGPKYPGDSFWHSFHWDAKNLTRSMTIQQFSENRRTLSRENADEVGFMLWRENVRSVNFRYSERKRFPAYVYRRTPRLTPAEIIQACDGYSYQSCEHPGWQNSEAYRFIHTLREKAISALLRDFEANTWSINDADLSELQEKRNAGK